MAIKTKAEILEQLNAVIGENTDDAAIALIEDVNDTIDDFGNKTKDNVNWKEKYEKMDKEWRDKYKKRFMSGSSHEDDDDDDDLDRGDKPLKFENLFKEM